MIDKELLAACKTAAEQIRRCDYTLARSTLLTAIKNAEAAMAEPQPDADGWIKWEGGECPIDTPAHDLFIRFRNGKEDSDYVSRAQSYYWQRERKAHPADIIAYRIVEGD